MWGGSAPADLWRGHPLPRSGAPTHPSLQIRRGGEGLCPLPRIFFSFQIVHPGAFSHTNSKVLFAIKCKERYVIVIQI